MARWSQVGEHLRCAGMSQGMRTRVRGLYAQRAQAPIDDTVDTRRRDRGSWRSRGDEHLQVVTSPNYS